MAKTLAEITKDILEHARILNDVAPSPATARLLCRAYELLNYPACDKDCHGDASIRCTKKLGHTGACRARRIPEGTETIGSRDYRYE